MPREKRSRRLNQTLSDADNEIAIHSDERSTALLATTLNIASESEMKTGAKRALAECLETDELYSEVVHDNMWTGNSASLSIARENATLPMLQTKLESTLAKLQKHEDTLRKHDDTLRKHEDAFRRHEDARRKYEDTNRAQERKISDLHHTINKIGQQNNAQYVVGFSQIRSRFLSTFKRDILKEPSSEDRMLIGQGNIVAHEGNFRGDAKLYNPEGFITEDGEQISPRNDRHVFKQLYGVDPSLAAIIDYTPTVLVLDRHATIISSLKFQTTDNFNERFKIFILSLEASNYASDYLDSYSPRLEGLRCAYRAFWDAVCTEVSRRV
ncbi:hypothetical protein BDV27DRAFT_166958 [Aspergillus caelatus]|uniref:Uncharacterized protein n=1 Tax=Aspergillus caelatus TaxID=61420 RepID=A0A5N6ZVL6_9EURO|nr:uncharacterized protein BDV27DRAFT_166958 [Aspergillus caelatus]KAE8361445.1 hypothetical protein BDV27DRAFT_166958 [Aspergillus caelatus]